VSFVFYFSAKSFELLIPTEILNDCKIVSPVLFLLALINSKISGWTEQGYSQNLS